jgi:hypothetical protein
MKKLQNLVLTVAAIALISYLALTNLELTLVLVAAMLITVLIKRACGPMADSV